MPAVAPEWLSVADVAILFGVSADTVYELAGRGQIPHGRFGRRLIFNKAEVEEWVRHARTEEPTEADVESSLPRPRRGRPGSVRNLFA